MSLVENYSPQFRVALSTDYNQIVDMEEVTGDFPWKIEHIRKFNSQSKNFLYVALVRNIVVGYVMAEKRDDCYHIVKIVGHPKFGHEAWDYMLGEMKKKLLKTSLTKLSVCVPDNKIDFQVYLRDVADFTYIETIPRMFADGDEPKDGYLFEFLKEKGNETR